MARSSRNVPQVKVISRHRADCPNKKDGKSYIRCSCTKALYWYQNDREYVVSANTADWQEAERRAFAKQAAFEAVAKGEPEHATVKDAVDLYLKSKAASGYKPVVIKTLDLIFRRELETFLAQKAIVYLRDVKPSHLEQLRATWSGKATTRGQRQARIKGFFTWAVNQGWVDRSPAACLERIKGSRKTKPTMALDDTQFNALVEVIESNKIECRKPDSVRRFLALALLQRWSGLALMDALTVEWSHFQRQPSGWYRLFLRRAKTGVDVFVSLAPDVAAQILTVPRISERYLFWNGTSSLPSLSETHKGLYKRASEAASLKTANGEPLNVHSHMLRDTFAVWCFRQGMATEDVAALLGHKNIRMTQEHYSPWIQARQERLGAIVERAYSAWQAVQHVENIYLTQ